MPDKLLKRRLSAEQQLVAHKLYPMSQRVAGHFIRRLSSQHRVHEHEFYSEASLAVTLATTCYDPANTIPLEKYAFICAWRNCKRLFKRFKPYGYRTTTAECPSTLPLHDINHDDFTDDRASPSAIIDLEEMLCEHLKPRDAYIVIRHFFFSESQEDIAVALGITKQRVNQLLANAKCKLRRAFAHILH